MSEEGRGKLRFKASHVRLQYLYSNLGTGQEAGYILCI